MKFAILTALLAAIGFATYLHQQNQGLRFGGGAESSVMQSMDGLGSSVANGMEGMSQKLGF